MGALWIKICGLRSVAAIAAAAQAGVQAVGFVFHAPSPRNLSVAQAVDLQGAVPPGIDRVAVFLHPSQPLLDAVVEAVRPDWVQADAADLAALRLPAGQRVLPVVRGGAWRPGVSMRGTRLLFESARSGMGEQADWDEAACLAREVDLVLAGGLDARNIGAAIAAVRPFGVDVSSGVESSRGVKDIGKIVEFVAAARAAHARCGAHAIEEMH